MYELILFTADQSPQTDLVIRLIKEILEDGSDNSGDLKIINILDSPELVNEYNIFATPTLIRLTPEPRKMVICNFSEITAIKSVLESA